ncbi:MAG: methylamine utilization protein MauG [Gemmatimonadetes bacterium]|nr:methylamine utilization protein MauG [Gemmatimonadota bacterium]
MTALWRELPLLLSLACSTQGGGQDATPPEALLRARAAAAGVTAVGAPPAADPALVALGRALFFDKIVSGNRDISCGNCHIPAYHTTDVMTLPIGTGGTGLAPRRALGTGAFSARNVPELYNRGHPGWRRLFWDGRVELSDSGLVTPAGAALPVGLSGPLAAQALFPMIARAEMRGQPGQNGIANLPDADPRPMWDSIVARVAGLPGYDSLARAAFPGRAMPISGVADLANAIAAFIGTRWFMVQAPFDDFLAGNDDAISPAAVRGGLLFFGRARCAACHRGPLLTDFEFHNVGVPELGPGIGGHPDQGRAAVSGKPADAHAYRTPSLRNVAHSPPYMHNGAYPDIVAAIRHYRDVRQSLAGFDTTGVDPRLRATIDLSPAGQAEIQRTLDPRVQVPVRLSDDDVADLLAFLVASPIRGRRSSSAISPAPYPGGLPVLH